MKKIKFYDVDANGKVKIHHYRLIKFLEKSGYARMRFSSYGLRLVKIENNIIFEVQGSDLAYFIKEYLEKINEPEVLEKYVQGIGSYMSPKKYDLLHEVKGFIDKDPPDMAWFYYQNVALKITKGKIESIPYKNITHPVWNKRIRNRTYFPPDQPGGVFKDFCFKLSKENQIRFEAFQTAIGYLLHRYNDPSLCKAIILVDENISFDGSANGGTGKSLMAKAFSYCKNLEFVEGKNTKTGSWFKNQRIGLTTDIVCYDDVGKDFSLVELYSMTTSGIIIEKKRQDEIHLSPEEAPKFMISSNYIVKGTGGASDIRRRYEFEVANFFGQEKQPLDVYGDLFFVGWSDEEWNNFDLFMMQCVQLYLNKSLIEAPPINLRRNRLINSTSIDFEVYSKKCFEIDTWLDKRNHIESFVKEFHHHKDLSIHKFTKWIKEYARQSNLDYDMKSSGGKHLFRLSRRKKDEN